MPRTAPTPIQQPTWLAEGDAKRLQVREMFGQIAPTYDLLNGLMSLGRHKVWRARAVRALELRDGAVVLDLCCGTGDFFDPLRRAAKNVRVLGADFCVPMLALASRKHPNVPIQAADACRLPFADESFDAVTIGWGLRNVADLPQALREIARVLRPGGRMVSVDMNRPRQGFARFASRVFEKVAPILGAFFGRSDAYRYLPKSVETFPTVQEFPELLESCGLKSRSTRTLCFGNVGLVLAEKK